DRCDTCVLPRFACVEGEAAWVEGFVGSAFAWEDEARAACALMEAVVDELAPQRLSDGDASSSGAAFRGDEAILAVPVSGDVDEVVSEVDVVPLKGLQFSCSEAGVECGGVD